MDFSFIYSTCCPLTEQIKKQGHGIEGLTDNRLTTTTDWLICCLNVVFNIHNYQLYFHQVNSQLDLSSSLEVKPVSLSVPGRPMLGVVVIVDVDLLSPPYLLCGHQANNHPEHRVLQNHEPAVVLVIKLVVHLVSQGCPELL